VAQWLAGELHEAIAGFEAIVRQHPRDLVAVKLGQYLAFNLGDAPILLRLALQARPAADDLAALHGMSGAWQGLTSFMRCHLWWHLALFQIDLGDDAAALALYDAQVWGVDKTYSQDQVGAVPLLARLELAGVAVGDRWAELAGWLLPRLQDQEQPFLDLQYLYGLARAGLQQADTLLAHIESFAPRAPLATRAARQRVAVPAAHGLRAHARGQWAEAADQLALALPGLASIGGSHAQRDLFEQLHLDALRRSGRLAAVQNLLQPRANAQPQSLRLHRQLQEVYAALGLPALAQH